MIHICKLYSSSDGTSFGAFGRIYSGTVQPGQQVHVLGEGYIPDEDDEDMAVATIEAVSIPRGRSLTNVTLATAGNWVLLHGVDATIANVNQGTFPLSRPLNLVTNTLPAGLKKDFIDFARSENVRDLVQQESFVPIQP